MLTDKSVLFHSAINLLTSPRIAECPRGERKKGDLKEEERGSEKTNIQYPSETQSKECISSVTLGKGIYYLYFMK